MQVQADMRRTPISQSMVQLKQNPVVQNNQSVVGRESESQFYTDINGFVHPTKKSRLTPNYFSFMGQLNSRPFNILTNEVKKEVK